MSFIHTQHTSPSYSPNMNHVIYGLNVDLIMLSLSTMNLDFLLFLEKMFLWKNKENGTFVSIALPKVISLNYPKNRQDSQDQKESLHSDKPFILIDIERISRLGIS